MTVQYCQLLLSSNLPRPYFLTQGCDHSICLCLRTNTQKKKRETAHSLNFNFQVTKVCLPTHKNTLINIFKIGVLIFNMACQRRAHFSSNMYIYTITVSKQTFLNTKLSFVRVLKIFLAVFSLITTFFFLFNYALVMLYTIAEILCLPLWLHNIIIDMCPNNIVVLSRLEQGVKSS